MDINTIEEAKKYIGKKVFQPFDKKIDVYYIGGVNLFYNQVNYTVISFELYEDKKCTIGYGDVKLDKIQTFFDKKFDWIVYTFSEDLAKQYLKLIMRTDEEREREREIEYAEELLKKHKVKYEIFN